MLIKTLENIGLTQKEAKVYLAALEIGSSPVSHIASKAKINRVTTYDILGKLSGKGLISSFTRAKVKFFTATEPEVVVDDFKRRVGNLEESLPEFKKLNGETVHTAVKYFEGIDGIRNIYEDALKSEKEIRNFGNIKDIRDKWPTYEEDFIKKRVEKEIPLKAITLDNDQGRTIQAQDRESFRETRLLAPELFNFSNEIFIYGNKVAIISFGEMVGMIIESPEIAKMQLTIFNLVWSFAEEGGAAALEEEITGIPVEQGADPTPEVEPSPEPTPEVEIETVEEESSTEEIENIAPEDSSIPEEPVTEAITEPTPEVETLPEPTPVVEPTLEPTPEGTPEPTPVVEPTLEPTPEGTPEPTPVVESSTEPTPETSEQSDNYLDPVPNLDEFETREHSHLSDREQDNLERENSQTPDTIAEQTTPDQPSENNHEQPATPFNNNDQIKLF